MRLGGFWGLTAPMMLIALHSDARFKDCFDHINTEMNREVIQDVHAELSALLHMRGLASLKFTFPDEPVSEQYADYVCDHGAVNIPGVPGDVVLDDLRSEMCLMLAQMIADGEGNDQMVRLHGDIYQCLVRAVDDAILSQEFTFGESRKVARKIYRGMKSESGKSVQKELADRFHGSLSMKKSFKINGNVITLSENARVVADWFLQRLDDVDWMFHRTYTRERPEEMVFGIAFHDLIKRKPESILYSVIGKFDQVKGKRNANALLAVCNDLKGDLKKFYDYFDKYVDSGEVSEDSGDANCPVFQDPKKQAFFESLTGHGSRVSDFPGSALDDISNVYDIVDKLDYNYLNEVFGLGCSSSEWDSLSRELCNVFICGINDVSLDLLYENLHNLSFATDVKVRKSNEYKESLGRILADLSSLLSTIRPIGEMIG